MDSLDASSFDFWLGEWDCVFDGGHAVNTITREFNDHVIIERFAVDTPQLWHGTSMSVYDAALDLWRQTWVDDGGSYWAFVGTLVDGAPSFATPGPVDTDSVFKRMVFTGITADAFHWRWESSPDGEAWTVNWEIDYTRRAERAAGR
jgi:hypothetical protein